MRTKRRSHDWDLSPVVRVFLWHRFGENLIDAEMNLEKAVEMIDLR